MGKFEDEEDAWEAVKKKKAEAGEVAKVKDNQLPQSKYNGVSWDRNSGIHFIAHAHYDYLFKFIDLLKILRESYE